MLHQQRSHRRNKSQLRGMPQLKNQRKDLFQWWQKKSKLLINLKSR